ncbi:hypothetical protein B9J07_28035 [Sinorhizobium sp. LM21]|uniref:hypothetical protein n=1 Tax=Sinorhizobium sp. LM21 TaxID=1449788 RepID=UPI0005D931CC|nr:hypothetical protein [Sinorhizobium sp. LM21]AJW30158.1 hypothetical protein pLM21S1_p37 [Sinorhizobium sp. LM21]OWZ90439.1 hypothetical protein B9J07_28035 [Sinorhizobium sp. LM21]
MNTESTSTAVAVVEPTLASVRAEREELAAKAAEARRLREKTYALQRLDGLVIDVQREIDDLDAEVKRLGERRKKLEETIAVGKSIDTNAALTADEIREVTKKAADVYYGRKEGEKTGAIEVLKSRGIPDDVIHFIQPHFSGFDLRQARR